MYHKHTHNTHQKNYSPTEHWYMHTLIECWTSERHLICLILDDKMNLPFHKPTRLLPRWTI